MGYEFANILLRSMKTIGLWKANYVFLFSLDDVFVCQKNFLFLKS